MDIIRISPPDCLRLKEKFPTSSLVIIKSAQRSNSDLPPLDKHKYIIPKSTTIGQFIFLIRKRMKLPPEKALFIFINNTIPTSNTTFAEVESKFVGSDGVIRILYTSESTFGLCNTI